MQVATRSHRSICTFSDTTGRLYLIEESADLTGWQPLSYEFVRAGQLGCLRFRPLQRSAGFSALDGSRRCRERRAHDARVGSLGHFSRRASATQGRRAGSAAVFLRLDMLVRHSGACG